MNFQPKYMYSPTYLKDVIKEIDGYTELTVEKVNQGIFDIVPANDTQKQMLYALVKHYQYAEIGYDNEERFVDRFKSLWVINLPYYEKALNAYNNIFKSVKSIDSLLERNGIDTVHSSGSTEEYDNPTRTVEGDTSTTFGSGNHTVETVEYTDYDVAKLDMVTNAQRILMEFVDKFRVIFMEVFTQL